MDRFERYLYKKQKFISDMIGILKSSGKDTLQIEVETLETQLEIIDDIIHHFKIFVKDSENV